MRRGSYGLADRLVVAGNAGAGSVTLTYTADPVGCAIPAAAAIPAAPVSVLPRFTG